MIFEIPSELYDDIENVIKYQNTLLIHEICKKYKLDSKKMIDKFVLSTHTTSSSS